MHHHQAILLSIFIIAIGAILAGCGGSKEVNLWPADLEAARAAGIESREYAAQLVSKPIYKMNEGEVNDLLGFAQERYPDIRERLAYIARKNLGQPYEIYLLGEAPFEFIDPQPLYCLDRSDCVVFCEHTYAMTLAHDWASFFAILQRIRYINGQIGVVTRNHYTEADWGPNNEWLVKDLTEELAGEDTEYYNLTVKRANFFKKRYKLDTNIPNQTYKISYLTLDKALEIADQLQTGDMVNFVRGKDGGLWVGHTGIVVKTEDGQTNIIHSTRPQVIEQPLTEMVAKYKASIPKKEAEGKAIPMGFKFLRLQDNALENLREIDGPDAPRIMPPAPLPAAPAEEAETPDVAAK